MLWVVHCSSVPHSNDTTLRQQGPISKINTASNNKFLQITRLGARMPNLLWNLACHRACTRHKFGFHCTSRCLNTEQSKTINRHRTDSKVWYVTSIGFCAIGDLGCVLLLHFIKKWSTRLHRTQEYLKIYQTRGLIKTPPSIILTDQATSPFKCIQRSGWKSTHNSRMNWHMFTKFDTQMHLGFLQNPLVFQGQMSND